MRRIYEALLRDPSLRDLPQLMEAGRFPALVSGLSPVHRPMLAAALYESTGRPLVVVCPEENAAEAFARDLATLLGTRPMTLFAREFVFRPAESASRQGAQARLRTLHALQTDTPPVVVATVSGLLQRTLPPETLEKSAFVLSAGETVPPEDVERKLLASGYTRTEQVEAPGQYARRGGILDLFSPAYDAPVRVDFWGDDVDGMGFFDVDAQRRTENTESCLVLPAAETLPDAGDAPLTQRLEALRVRVARGSNKRLLSTIEQDLARLTGGAELPSADRYMPLLYDFASAMDYLPPDALLLLSEPGRVSELGRGFVKQLAEDLKELIGQGLLYGGGAEFCLSWEHFTETLRDFAVVLADAFTVGRYLLEPKSILGAQLRQLPSYGGSAETALSDVKHYLGTGSGVVLLCGDARRAALMEERLRAEGLPASLDAELTALPAPGKCTVAVGSLSAGTELPGLKLAVLTDAMLTGTATGKKTRLRKLKKRGEEITNCADLSPGCLVVHEYHGIGRFLGIVKMPVDGAEKDYIKIAYAGSDVLYVPATQLDLVSKYVGAGGEDTSVRLSKMGGADWTRVKSRAKAAAKEMARSLIALYAARQRLPGHAFAPDSPWQK